MENQHQSHESHRTYIEKNIAQISAAVVLVGALIAFSAPYVMPYFYYFGLTAPNEIGDAFGGIANPIVGFVGVCLTFLAFYIQYKANERQTNELELQKRDDEYKFIKESIRDIKNDLKSLRYTKDTVTYQYSEAIWHFMIDNIINNNAEPKDKTLFNPLYYQIGYILTLFEPLITDIDHSKLSKEEKYQLLINIEGLFESSVAFVLHVYEQAIQEGMEKVIKDFVKHKLIIPSKKIKYELKDVLERYKESEKDLFMIALSKMKGVGYVKNSRYTNGKATVHFYSDYAEYKAANPSSNITLQGYKDYFTKDDNISKILINEPVRLLMKLDFLEKVVFNLPFDSKTYILTLDRKSAEQYFKMDLAELKIDKSLWRDDFLGRYVYDTREREKFVKKFVKISE